MRISLNRLRVDKYPPHKKETEEQVCELTISVGECRKLSKEIQNINDIYAGGKQNRRYRLVEL